MTTVARAARGGWDVESASTPIANRARIEQVETNVDAPTTPEMLFDSALELRHESGVALRFEAEDALREWVKLGLPAIEVAAAKTWRRSHVERFGDASIAATRDARGGEGVGTSADGADGAALPPGPSMTSWNTTERSAEYDWTFTTPYGGTVTTTSDSNRQPPTWELTDRRIDRAMLTERDPILMYDELTLYESELDDNGVAHLGLKVRVMPKCWFVLLRFWLRVDGVLIRLFETRFFCDFTEVDRTGAVVVVRETQRREETWDALRARRPVRSDAISRRRPSCERTPRRGRSGGHRHPRLDDRAVIRAAAARASSSTPYFNAHSPSFPHI